MVVSDPTAARILVYNVVVQWVARAVNLPPSSVNVSRTFVDAPSGGYGFTEGRYLQMCGAITEDLIRTSGRSLTLPPGWRVQHEGDAIATFINAVAVRLVAGKLTPAGLSAFNWAISG